MQLTPNIAQILGRGDGAGHTGDGYQRNGESGPRERRNAMVMWMAPRAGRSTRRSGMMRDSAWEVTALRWIARAALVLETAVLAHLLVYRRWLMSVLLGIIEVLAFMMQIPYIAMSAFMRRTSHSAYTTLSCITGVGVGAALFVGLLLGGIASIFGEQCNSSSDDEVCCGSCLIHVIVGAFLQLVLFSERLAITLLACRIQRLVNIEDEAFFRSSGFVQGRQYHEDQGEMGSSGQVVSMEQREAAFVRSPNGEIIFIAMKEHDGPLPALDNHHANAPE